MKKKDDKRGKHPNSLSNLQLFTPGNQAARQHGGYARHFPPDVVSAAEETDTGDSVGRLEEMVRLERMRLHSTLAAKARWDAGAEYNQLGSADMELSGIETTPQGTTIKRHRPAFELAIDRAVGRLLMIISEQERIASSPAGVATRLNQVLDEAAAAGLSAVDTGEACERAGIAAPFSLQQKIRAELATFEPPEPEGGMTDEELEALSAEYEQEVADEDAWLTQRHEEVAEIHQAKEREKHSD